ncbi:MAG TPA: triose-phosphate isomerase [Candidatus Saccharibacteria bacterium]|jgi:triosephosphate isomerase|nr:triose-phosphate isomerase [Candidatus Saccharibacteria bacterium]HMT55330.1 triose-phosphate isomerase [Candidatus Saccharibacteria bacterium]
MRNNRKIMIAANWKEHFTVGQASIFLHRLEESVRLRQGVEVVLFPNVLTLQPLSVQLDRRKFRLGAQDGYYMDAGAYTGEVSMAMLSGLVHYVLVGHSERRHIFNEHDDIAAKKVQAAVRNDIMPILCVGETLHERLSGETNQILHNQISAGLMNLTSREVSTSVIAYEPVWAIGTGEFAKPEQVAKAIDFIRKQVEHLYGPRAAKHVRILYGGSVDDHNIFSYLSLEGCDGALVGGASLNYAKFAQIVEAAYRIQQSRTGA